MKSKLTFSIVIVAGALLAGILYLQGASHTKLNLSVQQLGDKELFVGGSTKTLSSEKSYDHAAVLKAIDDAHEYMRKGDYFNRRNEFDKAAEEYKKAYMIDIGSRAVSGFLLAETYEKLGRYDDAIAQLNQMIQNHELSELGIQDAKEMITRLLAKNKVS